MILDRQDITLSLLSIFAQAIAVIPMIAFIGVLISCDIFVKNSVFASFARFADSYASFNALRESFSRVFASVIFCEIANTFVSTFPSHSNGINEAVLYTDSSRVQYSN